MTCSKTNSLISIHTLIEQKSPFAVYRMPGERQARLVTQPSGAIRLVKDLRELDEASGFVIAPFHAGESCPIVLIRPEQEVQVILTDEEGKPEKGGYDLPMPQEEGTPAVCSEKYASCFHTFMKALQDSDFQKLVLSRSLTLERTSGFSLVNTFLRACKLYIHSYVYLCYTPQTGIWLGSTPEIILSGGKGKWSTVALAGTQLLQNGKLPERWSEKQRREQEYVAGYIRKQLLSLGIRATESTPHPAYAGALSHLKTDFSFSLTNGIRPGQLLQLLHPTPAVCGLPKEEACKFILANEQYDRQYYSGFVGWLDPDGQTDLYVNLRCMQITDKELTLYAGGGLLTSSELDDEWQETEKKLQTMKRIIAE